ncbi:MULTISPECIES: SDR family NAD(P)-dependent oxidoreductase [Rhodococcus]|uniref:SDR family NAD(P)-dependent oxidoreductase n=1 Tax=Rhodococcus TaxID=1827 RepID=UPI00143E3DC1|nr:MULTISPECIES: SDR family oxidoreductase [Rhodococcus]MBC2590499.1 SDR family oxidoreductase [Rhodococcus aetherivorans]QIX48325.1 SDR family oxidoreductase [Rhodococcus sp. DMU1]QRI76593.1 SDR family oxidoreductase [Rhodococcus aetherivorans]QSE60009.1 SDR family oxidoreductase [Rhodococcus sp. PSBB066]QSE68685.1 SDR family oxidoreductase [Rhodococcus sp. PSBB049]
MTGLDGGSVIVTGGSRGIGAAVATALTGEGAGVVVADVLDDEGTRHAATVGGGATFVHLDVTNEEQWVEAVAAAESIGPLRALINNAGIFVPGTIEAQDRADFERVLQVDLVGAWLGMHVAGPALRRAHGVVVNISSTAGLTGYAGAGAYVASKWGLRGLTKTAALEFAPDGVRVCSVHPGPIDTPMTAGMDRGIAATQPIPRFGSPDEVARMVRFVVTEATYSTGSEFVVDGGATTGTVLNLETTDPAAAQ